MPSACHKALSRCFAHGSALAQVLHVMHLGREIIHGLDDQNGERSVAFTSMGALCCLSTCVGWLFQRETWVRTSIEMYRCTSERWSVILIASASSNEGFTATTSYNSLISTSWHLVVNVFNIWHVICFQRPPESLNFLKSNPAGFFCPTTLLALAGRWVDPHSSYLILIYVYSMLLNNIMWLNQYTEQQKTCKFLWKDELHKKWGFTSFHGFQVLAFFGIQTRI